MPERGITEILNRQQAHTYGCAVVLTRRISHLISRPCVGGGPTHAALRREERHHLQRSTGFSPCTLDARLRPSTYHQLSIIIPSPGANEGSHDGVHAGDDSGSRAF